MIPGDHKDKLKDQTIVKMEEKFKEILVLLE